MAAPTVTVRSTPVGKMLTDGYSSTFAFSRDPDLEVYEISGTPPPVEGGDPIDITTMHNNEATTKAPQALLDYGESSWTVGYDPVMYTRIRSLINQAGSVTQYFPDGTTLAAWAYLKDFTPSELQRGERPEAEMTIVTTNWDPTNRVEALPVLTEVSGT